MFLAVQLESRLIYCLNKACLTATASVISHRTVLTGSRPLGGGGGGGGREGSVQPPPPRRPPLCLWSGGGTAGAPLSLTLNGERSWKSRVAGQIYLEHLSFEMHTCSRVKDTWCILDALASAPSIRVAVLCVTNL